LTINAQIGASVEAVESKLHTVLLKPDERRLVMSWVGMLPCQGRTSKIRRVHVSEARLSGVVG
jgi:hypothetical protein